MRASAWSRQRLTPAPPRITTQVSRAHSGHCTPTPAAQRLRKILTARLGNPHEDLGVVLPGRVVAAAAPSLGIPHSTDAI
eukprot:2869176-Rhodomonas_salina.1